jgi:hypothetical protein
MYRSYGSEGRELEPLQRGKLGTCPLRARWESQERYLAGTHGQPNMVVDLQHTGQRRHDNPVPKLTVRLVGWLA